MAEPKQTFLEEARQFLADHCDTPVCVNEARGKAVSFGGTIRTLREEGWEIERTNAFCPDCAKVTSHYQMVGTKPSKKRATISSGLRQQFITDNSWYDNFTRQPSGKLELDHRVPHLLAEEDELPVNAENIASRYQALTPANNQAKRAACAQCEKTGTRRVFNGINHWLEGDAAKPADCSLCPWAYPELWIDDIEARLAASFASVDVPVRISVSAAV